MVKIYYRETDARFKANIEITEDYRFVIHLSAPFGENGEYIEVGKHGVKLTGHNTYSVLYSPAGYLIRDRENVQYRSKLKILPTNQITMGSRMKYEELENRYGGMVIMQIDTNTISGDVLELQMQLFRLKKENVTFSLLPDMQAEYLELDINEVFAKGSKRHSLWDTYSIAVDGIEYKGEEHGNNTINILDMSNKDFVEIEIQKYANQFSKALNREVDNEEVFIECTGGIANCQRVKLTNGKAKFRWYAFGFEGEMKIKLGWRWYSGIAEVRFEVKQ